jgi:dienelactone hydrolase
MTLAGLEPPRRNFSPWYQWMVRLSGTVRDDPFDPDDVAGFEAWRARCAARLDGLLGPWPEPVPLEAETTETVAEPGYTRSRVVFDAEAAMSVPAYLLVPEGRTAPGSAVVAVHGHGPGKSQVCGLDRSGPPRGDYAVQLVQRGHVVLAPDLRQFGERRDEMDDEHYACDTNLVHAVMAGMVPLTQNLFDLRRCLDLLAEHPLVDPDRLGVAGLSYGGTMSLFLAATDPRVRAAVVSGYFSSWAEAHKFPLNMCGSQVLPGMLGRLEHVDLGALIAPRGLLVESGTEDWIFPVAAAEEALTQLRPLWTRLGAPDDVVHDVFEGEHQWHGPAALDFLDRLLGP